MFVVCAGGIALNYTESNPKAQAEPVEAKEVSPLTKEQGFEQVAPTSRDQVARDRVETIEDKIRRVFGKDAEVAIAVAKAESGLDPLVVGDMNTKYHSIGVFQIRLLPERGLTMEQMQNADENINYAKMLFDKHGWKPWTCYNNGAYKKFLK